MWQRTCGGCRTVNKGVMKDRGTFWKGGPERVKAPYPKSAVTSRRHLSSAEHEKFSVNQRGPSRKAKYYRETDSEPVP